MTLLKIGSGGNVSFPFNTQTLQDLLGRYNKVQNDLTEFDMDRNQQASTYLRNLLSVNQANKNNVTNVLNSNANRGTALSSNYAKQRADVASQYNQQMAEQNIDNQQFLNSDRIQRANTITDYNQALMQAAAEQTSYAGEGYGSMLGKYNNFANDAYQASVDEINSANEDIAAGGQSLKQKLMDQLLGITTETNQDLNRLGHGNLDLAANFGEYSDAYKKLIDQGVTGDLGILGNILAGQTNLFNNRGILAARAPSEFSPMGGGGFAPMGGGFGGGYGFGGGGGYGGGEPSTQQSLYAEAMKNLNAMPKSLLGIEKPTNLIDSLIKTVADNTGLLMGKADVDSENKTDEPSVSKFLSSFDSMLKPKGTSTNTSSVSKDGFSPMAVPALLGTAAKVGLDKVNNNENLQGNFFSRTARDILSKFVDQKEGPGSSVIADRSYTKRDGDDDDNGGGSARRLKSGTRRTPTRARSLKKGIKKRSTGRKTTRKPTRRRKKVRARRRSRRKSRR